MMTECPRRPAADRRRWDTISAVSASFFDTLGARALHGRTFRPEEDEAEAPRVMVLSHAAWRQYFDGDPDVVGSAVPVGARREPFTVVGASRAGVKRALSRQEPAANAGPARTS